VSSEAEPTPVPEAPAKPRRRRWLWRIVGYGFVLLFLLVLGAAFGGYVVYDRVTRPGIAGEGVKIKIPEGAKGRDVAMLLKQNGLVEDEMLFRLAIRLEPGAGVKHGYYLVPKGLSPKQILELMRKGPNRAPDPDEIPPDQRVTVPEGLSLAQASQLFKNPKAFIGAASDPALVAQLGIKAPTLEGFLMPSTYYFDAPPTEREVVERMVKSFQAEYAKLIKEYPDSAGQDLIKIVTIASLVEEEAKVDEERPIIAAVVYNRLQKNMALGIDSTLQFALNKYGQRLLDADKAVNSPYNTYLNIGLPPGPICSPGLKSIRAALSPADVDYLYFVSNADGQTHTFTRTYGEHTKAVSEFRKKIAPQRRAQ
jgi:UPF0755 protein